MYVVPADFLVIKAALENANLHAANAEVTWIAATEITLDKENAQQMLKLQDILEDLDDVQNVYCNADIPEEML